MLIGGEFNEEIGRQLRKLAIEERTTNVALLKEAMDMLFADRGLPRCDTLVTGIDPMALGPIDLEEAERTLLAAYSARTIDVDFFEHALGAVREAMSGPPEGSPAEVLDELDVAERS